MKILVATTLQVFCSVVAFGANTRDDDWDCRSMKPFIMKNIKPNPMPPPFEVLVSQTRYIAQDTVTVSIRPKKKGFRIRGFIIQARRADKRLNQLEPLGTFSLIKGTDQTCVSSHGYGIANKGGPTGDNRKSVTVSWTAPTPAKGHLQFRVSVVSEPQLYWAQQRSVVLEDPNAEPLPLEQRMRLYNAGLSRPIEMEGCGTDKGCYRHPAGCDEFQCSAAMTWRDLGSQIEFEMTADTSGWVAFGLSDDQKMGHDSVTECVWNDKLGYVEIRQSYNHGKTNEAVTTPHAGLTGLEAAFTNGRVQCRFRRDKIIGDDDEKLFNLDPSYYLLLAKGKVDNSGNKMRHILEPHKEPYVSRHRVSLSVHSDISDSARYLLVKIHGCIMLVAWMVFAGIAIMMARYYKGMWPNDRLCREKVWFSVHRGCQIGTLILTAIGVIVIFIHAGGYSQMPDLPACAHPILGLIVLCLVFLNAFIACCRCRPDHKKRPIFNWMHWLVGTLAHVAAIPTLFIGLSLQKSYVPWWATWVMVAYMLFHLIVELLLEIHGCINGGKQKRRDDEYERAKKASPKDLVIVAPKTVGHNFKSRILITYICVVVVLTFVMIIAVAIG